METTDEKIEIHDVESAISAIIKPDDDHIDKINDSDTPEEESEEVESVEDESDDSEELESDEDSDDEDDEAEVEDDDDQEAPEFYTVKVDGEDVQVSLDDLKRGYSGQQYVQKGMQQAAAARKQAEEVYQSLLNERQQVSALYQQIQSGAYVQPPQEPTADMFHDDPIGYMEAKMQFDSQKAEYDKQMTELQQITQQQSAAEQEAREAYLQQEVEKIRAVIPEFSDAEKATKLHGKMVQAGSNVYGYSPAEINSTLDHRALHVLHDAMKYREILAGKATAEKKAKPAKRVIKPGAKRNSNPTRKAQKDAQARLKRSGSVDDALALIMNT